MVLVVAYEPAVQAAFGVVAEDLGRDEHEAGPLRQPLRQRFLQVRVGLEHDIDVAGELVPQHVESDTAGGVGGT